jgi:hypothetical protein
MATHKKRNRQAATKGKPDDGERIERAWLQSSLEHCFNLPHIRRHITRIFEAADRDYHKPEFEAQMLADAIAEIFESDLAPSQLKNDLLDAICELSNNETKTGAFQTMSPANLREWMPGAFLKFKQQQAQQQHADTEKTDSEAEELAAEMYAEAGRVIASKDPDRIKRYRDFLRLIQVKEVQEFLEMIRENEPEARAKREEQIREMQSLREEEEAEQLAMAIATVLESDLTPDLLYEGLGNALNEFSNTDALERFKPQPFEPHQPEYLPLWLPAALRKHRRLKSEGREA